jgi:uncharacterized protein
MKEIIIAGGTGLIGTVLCRMLLSSGYRVNVLSRHTRTSNIPELQYYKWDIAKKEIPVDLFYQSDTIINLSGANVGERRWNEIYKNEIMESRVKSTRLIVDILRNTDHKIKTFLNGSAIGYYGINFSRPAEEDDQAGDDFMAKVCVAWESEARKLDSEKVRLVIARTGIVFSSIEGAMHQMMTPIKLFAGAALGSGNQMVSWIHIDDVCRALIFAMENTNVIGPINLVAPHPATNLAITRALAKVLRRPILLPGIPEFILKLILGEFATSVTGSQIVSARKLLNAGFEFNHPQLEEAIQDLISNNK